MVVLFAFIITVIEIYYINSFLLHGGTCDRNILYKSFLLHGGTCDWCVLFYINTNESVLVCTIIYQYPMRVHWCVLLYIITNESRLVYTITYQHRCHSTRLYKYILPNVDDLSRDFLPELWGSVRKPPDRLNIGLGLKLGLLLS